jgi:prepilin-type N-terminal cleavage/methylation domain-containing protein
MMIISSKNRIYFCKAKFVKNVTQFKKAFTLAEIIITIGIVGIVAALTIPTLAKKIKEKRTAVHLKKVYSQVNQAFYETIGDGFYPCDPNVYNMTCSDILNWTRQLYVNEDFISQFVLKFKTSRTTSDFNNSSWTPNYFKCYKTLSNGTVGPYNMGVYAFELHTGELILLGKGPYITVDLDGFGHGKDTIGEDVFFFKIYDTFIRPLGAKGTYSEDKTCGCSKDVGVQKASDIEDSQGQNMVSGACCAAYYLNLK